MTPQAWRQNPNLVECFDNCVAMFAHDRAAHDRLAALLDRADAVLGHADIDLDEPIEGEVAI